MCVIAADFLVLFSALTSWSSRSGLNRTRTTPPCYNNTTLGNHLYAQRKGPNVTNPIYLTGKNCSHKCAADCKHCVTIQHRAVLIIFPLNLQTITITRILSSGGEGQICGKHREYGIWAKTEIVTSSIRESRGGYDPANKHTGSPPTTTKYCSQHCFTAYDFGSSVLAVVVLTSPRSTASFSSFTTCLQTCTA